MISLLLWFNFLYFHFKCQNSILLLLFFLFENAIILNFEALFNKKNRIKVDVGVDQKYGFKNLFEKICIFCTTDIISNVETKNTFTSY